MKSSRYINGKGNQYSFLVNVYTRPNLRGSVSEMIMYQGQPYLRKMFDEGVSDPLIKNIHFEYPERWANILELRAMPERIPVTFPNIEEVTITTHSVYIIQCVHSQHIRVCDDSSLFQEVKNGYSDLSVKYAPAPSNMEGLWSTGTGGFKKIN